MMYSPKMVECAKREIDKAFLIAEPTRKALSIWHNSTGGLDAIPLK